MAYDYEGNYVGYETDYDYDDNYDTDFDSDDDDPDSDSDDDDSDVDPDDWDLMRYGGSEIARWLLTACKIKVPEIIFPLTDCDGVK